MDILNHVGSDEEVFAQADVHSDPYAVFFSGKAGEIACTGTRLIYRERKKTITIPASEVGSIEFEGPRMPRAYLYTGVWLHSSLRFLAAGFHPVWNRSASSLDRFYWEWATYIGRASSGYSHPAGTTNLNHVTARSSR